MVVAAVGVIVVVDAKTTVRTRVMSSSANPTLFMVGLIKYVGLEGVVCVMGARWEWMEWLGVSLLG